MLKVGDKAPDFKSTDQDGNPVKLADFKGKRVVLYFYPKDDTPGCTKEACSFRDADADASEAAVEEVLAMRREAHEVPAGTERRVALCEAERRSFPRA